MDKNVNIASLLLQIISLDILFKDYNNSDLMNELQHQNRDYLEKIIEQNKDIIKLLKERSGNNGR